MAEFRRSPEERERARLERQRRRAGRGPGLAAEPPDSSGRQADGDGFAAADGELPPRSVRVSRGTRPRRPAPAPGPRRPSGHSRPVRVMAVLALVLVGLVIWFLVALFQPFYGSGQGRVTVTIPHSASTSQVADILDR